MHTGCCTLLQVRCFFFRSTSFLGFIHLLCYLPPRSSFKRDAASGSYVAVGMTGNWRRKGLQNECGKFYVLSSRFDYEHQPAVGFVSSTTNKRHYSQDGKECGSVGVAPSKEKQKVNLDRWHQSTDRKASSQTLSRCIIKCRGVWEEKQLNGVHNTQLKGEDAVVI